MTGFFLKTALLFAILTSGCARTINPSERMAVASEGARLIQEHHEFGDVAASQWPASIVALEPEQVYLTPEGLYIATDSFFVEEEGFFVPNPANRFAPEPGGDPAYVRLSQEVFSYQVKG